MELDDILDLLIGLEQAYKQHSKELMLHYIVDLRHAVQMGNYNSGYFTVMMTGLVSYVAIVGCREANSLDDTLVIAATKRILGQMTSEKIQGLL